MPLTILVADDDPGTCLAVSDYLELKGYSVIAADNGAKALDLVGHYRPHLLVTDVTMPQMDGYELVRQVRLKPEFRLLPVIFLTARSDTQERIRGYQLGGDAYLAKPFELEELGAVVRNLLERSQLIATEWRSQATVGRSETDTAVQPVIQPPASRQQLLDFTGREIEVLSLLSEGLSNNQIGEQLHLSPRTIEKYVSSLLRKTEANNRAELVRYAMEHHLVD
ncbi:response regulator transcription factor [Leptolyngbya sp. FACHB-711]|uniref:response regulator transcription factor n=1 Tax=unclassified Leptolyngbya TaxID=2650499 RepID=UPI001688E442|nr:response regulator transcription factor [Leptolyngbya sp. FACHB-711]MBD1850175.1 response regulator transcription factor [Cyanobacteria bacterium FACHB-502]MBD2023437.1 response regulator transcription factor [Leptolyngbya sp. FACHB-711]